MKRVWIHLADDEWGSRLMESLACEYAWGMNRQTFPLIVTVHEHAGWWLSYGFESNSSLPIIVGTANDMASLSPEAHAFAAKYKDQKPEYLGSIRRNDLQKEVAA